MGKIYYIMGKSASGKDSIFKELKKRMPQLREIVLYTTRPIRENETEGAEYHFVNEEFLREMQEKGGIMGVKVKCELVKKEKLIEGIYKFSVKAPEIARTAKPGQFLEIKVSETGEPYLRRPISIFNINGDMIEFIFQVKGRGTELLSKIEVGKLIDIMGPLGNGSFKVQEYNNVAIIGGGIGTYPLYDYSLNESISKQLLILRTLK